MVHYIALAIGRLGVWAAATWLAAMSVSAASSVTGLPRGALCMLAVTGMVVAVVAGYVSGPRWLSRLLPLGPLGRDGHRLCRAARIRGDHAKMARRLAWRWPTIMADCGLATKEAGAYRAKVRHPDILRFQSTPKGLKLTVEPIAQVPAGEIAAHADNIAAALKAVRCEISTTDTHLIELTLVDRDPLAGTREADWTELLP